MDTQRKVRLNGGLRRSVTFVELDGNHSAFLRVRVKISRDTADRLTAESTRQGIHSMVYLCDLLDEAFEDHLAEVAKRDPSSAVATRALGDDEF